jgi:hypothetical protein
MVASLYGDTYVPVCSLTVHYPKVKTGVVLNLISFCSAVKGTTA